MIPVVKKEVIMNFELLIVTLWSSNMVCDEYSHATIRYMTLYMYSLLVPIRDSYSAGTSPPQLNKGFDAYCTISTSRYAQVRIVKLTNHTTRRTRSPMLNEVSNAGQGASLVY
jgi:hypothetical protein